MLRSLACEQAPKWGVGTKLELGAARLTDFSFRPLPHLGAYSQAMRALASHQCGPGLILGLGVI